jgi:hypothetical protein
MEPIKLKDKKVRNNKQQASFMLNSFLSDKAFKIKPKDKKKKEVRNK